MGRHKSAKPLYCRWCGKAIAKYTISHRVPKSSHSWIEGNKIVTLEHLKRLSNEQIVSVKYHYENESYEDLTPNEIYSKQLKRRVSGQRTIYSYSTWDGETYVDPFFCNGDHARQMGYAAAEKNWATKAWRTAQIAPGEAANRDNQSVQPPSPIRKEQESV